MDCTYVFPVYGKKQILTVNWTSENKVGCDNSTDLEKID